MLRLCSGRRGAARQLRGRNAGFSLIEIIVVLAVVVALSAVLVPVVVSRIQQGEAASLGATLAAVRDAVFAYRTDVRRYPTHLRYLTEAPVAATDICGRSVPAAYLSSWQGPYLGRSISAAGIEVANAIVLDSIGRSPTTFNASTTGELLLRVQQVDSAVARRIERDHDTALDFGAGVIRWTDDGNGRGTLHMAIPVRGC
jgi:prepilin-type N-terminal cleavage/methylation domain-containing protein